MTQAEWQVVMGHNPSNFREMGRPVESVSWNQVQEFVEELNEMDPR